ncbi:DUF4199 domain-containing protein [Flavobacterium salilacus subsp. salilacus]|uniref:DUF4199 domain-containing protein n=1 Tax=Flavobacterium TaxID=237 RepID=UPI0010755E36|nr:MULTISPECIES: DUF4199 domain-containing protein [Flavobacterium]KAF2518501.1 DUF4199 domain-containing protein [Flavobacterium salilacus subsp. salilacus]MBE1615142.1 DUF4199 domain-containing protein [Flavobacterium sp. SaA2.13]
MTDIVKKNGLNFGIIIGVFSILVTTMIYIVDVKMFASYWIGILSFFISLIIAIIAVVKSKKALGGYISFKEAFTVYFIVMVVGSAIGSIFMYILFNLIDPASKDIIMEAVIEKTVAMMQSLGSPTGDIKTTVEQIETTDNFSIASQIKSFIWGLVFYIIIGLIVAAAMKKSKPEFEN